MQSHHNRGESALAGILAGAVILLLLPDLALGETNTLNNAARYRDDKSAVVNLAIQAVQQLQTEQQTNLRATSEIAKSVASLRRLTLLMGVLLAVGMLALLYYERCVLRSLQQRVLMTAPRPHSPETAAIVPQLVAHGQALLNHKEVAAALACFDEAIALDTHNPDIYVKKGLALEQLGRLDDALASFDHALALNVSLADAYVGKGDTLNRLERYREALDCFDHAARLQPKPATSSAHMPTEVVSGPH